MSDEERLARRAGPVVPEGSVREAWRLLAGALDRAWACDAHVRTGRTSARTRALADASAEAGFRATHLLQAVGAEVGDSLLPRGTLLEPVDGHPACSPVPRWLLKVSSVQGLDVQARVVDALGAVAGGAVDASATASMLSALARRCHGMVDGLPDSPSPVLLALMRMAARIGGPECVGALGECVGQPSATLHALTLMQEASTMLVALARRSPAIPPLGDGARRFREAMMDSVATSALYRHPVTRTMARLWLWNATGNVHAAPARMALQDMEVALDRWLAAGNWTITAAASAP